MGGGDLNLKKSWHPATLRNIEKVWQTEQKAAAEKRKVDQLRKELEEERQKEELKKLHAAASGKKYQEKVDWMYSSGPMGSGATLADEREEFLLGRKKVDKIVEQGTKVEELNPTTSTAHARTGNSVYGATANTLRDMQSKIRDDPLLMIKKREQQAIETTLANPLRVKEIKEKVEKTKKEKKEKKKRRKDSDSDSDDGKRRRKRSRSRSRSRSPDRRRERSLDRRDSDRRRERSPERDRRRERSPYGRDGRRDRERSPIDKRRRSPEDRRRSPDDLRRPSPHDARRRSPDDARRRSPEDWRRRSRSPRRDGRRSPVRRGPSPGGSGDSGGDRRDSYRRMEGSRVERDGFRGERERDFGRRSPPRSDYRANGYANGRERPVNGHGAQNGHRDPPRDPEAEKKAREEKLRQMMEDAEEMDTQREVRVQEMAKERAAEEARDAAERSKRLKESSGFAGTSGSDAGFLKGIQSNIVSGGAHSAADLIQRRRNNRQRDDSDFL
ncbi:Pre-mRNA splicing factor-domain-containing protein [Hyaloraphidium curvatum]|nr:Pre-mRNA splicing factor-domain-containing protein [Hyaloraphidium curvatum]